MNPLHGAERPLLCIVEGAEERYHHGWFRDARCTHDGTDADTRDDVCRGVCAPERTGPRPYGAKLLSSVPT